MNKLPLDLEPNFQDAEFYKALAMAITLYEGADHPDLKQLAEQSLDALVIAWVTTTNPTEQQESMMPKKQKPKKIKARNLTHLEHIKRNGAGAGSHGDKRKEASKKACRKRITQDDE